MIYCIKYHQWNIIFNDYFSIPWFLYFDGYLPRINCSQNYCVWNLQSHDVFFYSDLNNYIFLSEIKRILDQNLFLSPNLISDLSFILDPNFILDLYFILDLCETAWYGTEPHFYVDINFMTRGFCDVHKGKKRTYDWHVWG